jgi:hypothetical protein
MMMKRLLIILLLSVQAVWAQVEFTAKPSKSSIALNERLRVDFTMNADGDNFAPPSFEGFRVVGGPTQMMSQSWVNGRGSFNKTYTYYLMPTQRGTLTIRQASVEIDGQVYKTSPVKITVTEAVEQPRDPNDPRHAVSDALQLVAEVSKTTPYINEPITVVYKLYFDYNVGIREFRELEKPKYKDFWSQNIEIKTPRAEETTFNGNRCLVAVLKKTVLYPQKAGKLEIEPLSLDVEVELPTNRRNFWGQVMTVQDHKRVSAGARTINVKPLPENGKPADFSGAVGQLDFSVTPSKTTLKSGESLDLVVSVSGKGNLKLFTLPKPTVPPALEMYDPVHKESVNTTLAGMSGKITDTYTIIPQAQGKYPIQPITFSYFDPSTGRYKTVSSPEIMINVLDGPGVPSAIAQAPSAPSKEKITPNEQFRFIKLKTNLQPKMQPDFLGSNLFYTLMIAPLLAIPLLVLLRRRKEAVARDVVGNRIRQSGKLARKYLSEAKANQGNKEAFYVALQRSLHNFLKAKLHIETSDMHKARIREILQDKGASATTVDDFIRLIESCEFARYAPSSDAAMQLDYDNASTVIEQLEKQLR